MQDRTDTYKRRHQNILKAGTPLSVIKDFYRKRGWIWVQAVGELVTTEEKTYFGKIRTTKRANVLFKADNLPKQLCVAITTQHAVAVEDHVVLDSYDSRVIAPASWRATLLRKATELDRPGDPGHTVYINQRRNP